MGFIDTKVKVAGNIVGEYDLVPNPLIEEVYDDEGKLISVKLHGHTKIRDFAFNNCVSLVSIVIPKTLTYIGDSAFGGCENLSSVTIPDGVMSIGEDAFNGCISITSVIIPKSVTFIGTYAFANCQSLTSVIFKGKPETMYDDTFTNCTNITEIKVPWSEGAVAGAPWGATNATITYNYTE